MQLREGNLDMAVSWVGAVVDAMTGKQYANDSPRPS